MNFNKIYEVTHNLDAPLQPIEDGRPVREAEEQEQTAANPEKEESLGTNTENSQEVSTETDTSQGIDDLKKLSKILETGQPDTIKNKELGDIVIVDGKTGKNNGYGIKHIIAQQVKEGKKDPEGITALFILLCSTLRSGNLTKVGKEKYKITSQNDIQVIVDRIVKTDPQNRKRVKATRDMYLITGYSLDEKGGSETKKATDAIQTGIAQYGYAPEFSYFRKQVGAVASSVFQYSKNPIKNQGVRSGSF